MAFVDTFMRQHWLTHDVTDSKNVWHIGAQLLINVDKATIINFNTRLTRIQQLTVRHAANRNQHRIIALWLCWRFFAFHRDIDTVFFGFYRCHFGFQHQIELLADPLGKDFHHVFICCGDHLIKHFDHVNLRTQCVVNGPHFQTNDTTAHHQQALRNRSQCQCVS